jgi:hypothetical protein
MSNSFYTDIVNNIRKDNTIYPNSLSTLNQEINSAFIEIALFYAHRCTQNIIETKKITSTDLVFGFTVQRPNNVYQFLNQLIDFSCLNHPNTINTISEQLSNLINDGIKAHIPSDIIALYNDFLKDKSQEYYSTIFAPNDTGAINEMRKNLNVEANRNVETIVKNTVASTLKQQFFLNCIKNVDDQQEFNLGSFTPNTNQTIRINTDQSVLTNYFTNCINRNNLGARIVTDVATNVGIAVTTDLDKTVQIIVSGKPYIEPMRRPLINLVQDNIYPIVGVSSGAIGLSIFMCLSLFFFIVVIIILAQ